MTDFKRLLEALTSENVEFVVVGGIAVIAYGHTRLTTDLDICYARSRENLARLARAVRPLHARLRGAPADLPFTVDVETLRSGLNFTLETDAGDLDLLGEITGVGAYAEASDGAVAIDLYGQRVSIMSLDLLERAKRAAGRLKDLPDIEAIAEIKKRR